MHPSGRPRGGLPVRCVQVGHVYHVDGADVAALDSVNLEIGDGETVALFGPSGSGKSTLLTLLAGLRRATTGEIWVGYDELGEMSEIELLRMRRRHIGVVVQNPSRSLLPYGTAEDNLRFAQRPARRDRHLPEPADLLAQLGLAHLAGQRAGGLSGGEQQRLSIAVAMSVLPRLLLADEPTSQLDSANRDLVVELFERVGAEFGATIAVVTHDPVVADALDRRISLSEGRVVGTGGPDDPGARRNLFEASSR